MKFNRIYYLTTVGLLSIGFLVGINSSAKSANDDGTGSANIISAIGIAADRDLHFGDIVPNQVGGGSCTVILSAAETTVRSGTCTAVNGAPTSGSFNISGEANAGYVITLPAGNVAISRVGGGGASMNMSSFTHSYGVGNGTLSGAGADTFYVGATLSVSEAQMVGTYEGLFNVTVEYD